MSDLVESSLDRFHPTIAAWFSEQVGPPTDIQDKAWKIIASERHCLISAATGSGKTLAAFLWAINQLAIGEWEGGQTRVLYISPLKALNNDIRRNLLTPLAALEERFLEAGHRWACPRVMTRSGDTEQSDRRKMLRKPPEILITTPESLNLLLASKDGQRSLLGIKSVILDEIHSVVGSKRGVYLMTGVERLAQLTGEFQRIALSATVKPMERVAAFVGGFRGKRPRGVALAESSAAKQYEIEIRFPEDANEDAPDDDFWHPIVLELKRLVEANQSTLIFVNSRRLCEKITHKINAEEPAPIAYSHHGSLSKEIRGAVEQRLKNGELKAIVATNSLEMGIDIGALDCVIMVQSPNMVSSAIQKVGRAGHQVGATSKAVVFPSHSRDFLESAVLSQAIRGKDIEAVRPVERPLDVLAQVIVSSLGAGDWDIDALFELICSSYPYRALSREQYDLVINMLAGRYSGSRLRELKPRIAIDRSANVATLRKGALMAFYFSGGVIPDRGYFHLRLKRNGSRIGELDEEFVWERSIGDVFSLGAQSWRVEQITYNDVFVSPAESAGPMPPFWKSERFDRDFHFSQRIGDFLEWANETLSSKSFETELEKRFALDSVSAKALSAFLRNQKIATGTGLPHRHHVVAELINAGPTGAPGQQLILHTHWGGRVNRPYAMALDAAWVESFGHRTEIYVSNDCVVIALEDEIGIEEILRLVTADNIEEMLRKRLQGSGFFGARFREAAGTSLLITRNKPGQRLPLWLSRLRAKKLFESVSRYEDFPLLLEARRTCLKDEFDMDGAQQVLVELEQGEIDVSFVRTSVASPFASSVAWRQINDEYMYATDDPSSDGKSNLREDLVRSVAFDDDMRPSVSRDLIRDFEQKRQRLAEGYAPTDSLELKEWLRDRIFLRSDEWEAFSASLEFDSGDRSIAVSDALVAGASVVYLTEEKARVDGLLSPEIDSELFVEWLSYYGPVSVDWLRKCFSDGLTALLDALVDDRQIVVGRLVADSEDVFVCDADNFETLLRMNRARSRGMFEALPIEDLGLFLAQWQGVVRRADGKSSVFEALDRMLGFTERVALWEEDYLPARIADYQSSWLDSAMLEEGILWYGNGDARIGFCLRDDWELTSGKPTLEPEEEAVPDTVAIFGESGGKFEFSRLKETTGLNGGALEDALWKLVWLGKASNDAFASIRRGLAGNFRLSGEAAKAEARAHPLRIGRRSRGAKVFSYPGNWYALPEREPEEDPIAALELAKERARILLDRYGVLFRELLQREAEGFRWRDVFKALRLLELSGEIVGGQFFEGIHGLQFVSQSALRRLKKPLARKEIYWLSVCDPASLCGLGLESLKGRLPKRLASSRLVYRGAELVLEIHKNGKSLVFHVEPEDPDMQAILDALEHLQTRSINPMTRIVLEDINEKEARKSPYLAQLSSRFRLHRTHKMVILER